MCKNKLAWPWLMGHWQIWEQHQILLEIWKLLWPVTADHVWEKSCNIEIDMQECSQQDDFQEAPDANLVEMIFSWRWEGGLAIDGGEWWIWNSFSLEQMLPMLQFHQLPPNHFLDFHSAQWHSTQSNATNNHCRRYSKIMWNCLEHAAISNACWMRLNEI